MKFRTANYDSERAEELRRRLVENPLSPLSGVLMNDLLAEFGGGYPLQNLRDFLQSGDPDVVKIGAWIASELGEMGKPLLDDISRLLTDPESKIRFLAIDCLLLWADPSKGAELASVARLIGDPELRVRWKVMDFLSRATTKQLSAALSYLSAMGPQTSDISGLQLLLRSDADAVGQATRALQDQDGVIRKYGVVLARRIAEVNRDPLLLAVSSSDPDVKDFAESSISLL